METITAAELTARLRAAFGPRWSAWAYRCPACGTVATGAALVEALDPVGVRPDARRAAFDALGQECLERVRWRAGARPDRVCDARAVTHGTVLVARPDGTTHAVFPLATTANAPPDASRDALPDAPQDRGGNASGRWPSASPGEPDRVRDYEGDDTAQNNRLAKAAALADAMQQLGLGVDDVFAADRKARLAARLAARKAAFGPAPRGASDTTWKVTAGILRSRALSAARTPG